MKVAVTEMPETPRDCLFSVQNCEVGYVCTLRAYIPEADESGTGYKPKCVCKNVNHCECLEVVK